MPSTVRGPQGSVLYFLCCSCVAASSLAERLAPQRGTHRPSHAQAKRGSSPWPFRCTGRALLSRASCPDSRQGPTSATTRPVSRWLCMAKANKQTKQNKTKKAKIKKLGKATGTLFSRQLLWTSASEGRGRHLTALP